MHSLRNIVKEYFENSLYVCEFRMESSREKKLTIVTDNLRGVCGITVVTVLGPAEPISAERERTILKVKFHQLEPTPKRQLIRMSKEALRIDGVYSFRPIKPMEPVVSRIYRVSKKKQIA